MFRLLAIASVAALGPLSGLAGSSYGGGEFWDISATCADGSNVVVEWTWAEDPDNPTDEPAWVGYDVLRRSLTDCGDFVRLNNEPFPRLPGDHSHTFTEPAPSMEEAYEYRVFPVDANHRHVFPGDCVSCWGYSFISCPEFSAPIAQGTVVDMGWTMEVQPCLEGCYAPFYVDGVEELRDYAGTETTIAFYGRANCGTFEVCGLYVERFETRTCGTAPVEDTSWGLVKALYR